MTNNYQNITTNEKKKPSVLDLLKDDIKKAKCDPQITCSNCKEFSGWYSDDFIHYVIKEKEVKEVLCKNCGKVCVTLGTKRNQVGKAGKPL